MVAAAAFSCALLGVRTADADLAAFLGADEIKYCRADDQHDHGDCYVICNAHIMPSARIQP